MSYKKLDLRLSEAAALKLDEMRRRSEIDGTSICLSYVEETIQTKNGERVSASAQWQVSLIERSSAATIPAWYMIGGFMIFVPSIHLIDKIVGKQLDYRMNRFEICA